MDMAIFGIKTKKEKEVMHFGNGFVGMKKTDTKKLWRNLFFNKAVGE